MRPLVFLLLISSWAIFLLGCGNNKAETSNGDDMDAIRRQVTARAWDQIPSARQFKALFQDADGFIYYLNAPERTPTFVATAYLHDRYTLHYRIEFHYNRAGEILDFGEPQIDLSEITKVSRDPNGSLRLKHGGQ